MTQIKKHNIPCKVHEIIDSAFRRTIVVTPAEETLRAFVADNLRDALGLLLADWHDRRRAGGESCPHS